jgi:hypothetical protein
MKEPIYIVVNKEKDHDIVAAFTSYSDAVAYILPQSYPGEYDVVKIIVDAEKPTR